MKNHLIFLLLSAFLFVGGCFSSKQDAIEYKGRTARFLWTQETIESFDGDISSYQRQPRTFPVAYSDLGLTWALNWKGKSAIAYETDIGMNIPADPVLAWEAGSKDFSLSLDAWIDPSFQTTASGILFWTNNGKQAMGIRWKVRLNLQQADFEVFRYHAPNAVVLVSHTFALNEAEWFPIALNVNNNHLTASIAGKTLHAALEDADHRGNRIGLYQKRGIGFISAMNITPPKQPLPWETAFRDWNRNLFLATANRLIKLTSVPEEDLDLPLMLRRLRFQRLWKDVVPVLAPSTIRTKYFCDPGAKLTVGYGILPAFALSSATAEFVITLESDTKKEELFRHAIQPSQTAARDTRFHEIELDMSAYADQALTLDFEVRRKGSDDPLIACWANPIITHRHFEPNKPNVLLIVLDTLRADKLGCYGYSRETTPHIDAFAQSSTLFENVYAQSSWTFPSHASLFTSLYPGEANSDSRQPSVILGERYKTMAEMLRRQGYLTAAFTGDLSLNGASGISQGFNDYREAKNFTAFNFEITSEWYQTFVKKNEANPWFVFLHSYSCHLPSDHEHYLDYRTLARTEADWVGIQHDRYDGGVRYADVFVNDALTFLEERGLLDSTLVIITSDHGEDLGDRGYPLYHHHGHSLHDELTRVPLIMRLPGALPTGKRVETQVRLIDLLPTVLDILGMDNAAWLRGASLSPVIDGQETGDRFAYSEEMRYGVEQKSLRDGRYAFLWIPDKNDRRFKGYNGWDIPVPPTYRLYDILKDPGERNNLADRFPERVETMQKQIEKLQATFLKREYDNSDTGQGLSAEDEERMRKHGYVN